MILLTPATALVSTLSIKIEAHATDAQVFLIKAREADGAHGEAELNAAAALLDLDLADLADHSGPLPIVIGGRYAMVTLTRSQVETGNSVAHQLLAGARLVSEAKARASVVAKIAARVSELTDLAELEAILAALPVKADPEITELVAELAEGAED
jgi:hypothetical protein